VIAVARVPLDLFSFLPSIRSRTMLNSVCPRLLLTAFPTPAESKTTPAVYNNTPRSLSPTALPPTLPRAPNSHQLTRDQRERHQSRRPVIVHNRLEDGSAITYGYKRALGDPAPGYTSRHAFSIWAYLSNGMFYHQVLQDVFERNQRADPDSCIRLRT